MINGLLVNEKVMKILYGKWLSGICWSCGLVFLLGGGTVAAQQRITLSECIAKALELYNTTAYRKDLKLAGFLTRDSRVVERKKAGLKKARKGQVFSKR